MLKTIVCTIFYVFWGCVLTIAQQTKQSAKYINYIEKYHSIAQEQQKRHGIPASITLAQGLLESQCGESRLAKEGNNHFGIKCTGWNGDTIRHDDDELQECFRRYKSAEESYNDHSLFLKRKRYSPLFSLSATDYAAWARTLKACGYATDPAYPDKLIRIIETYELFRYDSAEFAKSPKKKNAKEQQPSVEINDEQLASEIGNQHVIRRRWGLYYVVAHEGDTFASLAKELNIKDSKLAKFNDLNKKQAIAPGEIIWIQEKENKAAMGNDTHTVQSGETLHSIAQHYGIKLKKIAKMNRLKEDAELEAGTTLLLR
ncbi:MAG: glucosaminidase domain-containing protein [Muribaculaceae bacterium]